MSSNFYEYALKIDNLIENYSNKNLEIIESYFKIEGIKNYFIRKLGETSNPFPWLNPLYRKGYFNPKYNPKPKEDFNNPGFFIIPYWPILGFLENVAIKNEKAPDDEITGILLEIIDKLISYKDEKGNRIENYRTDWILIKIIFSMPKEKIKQDYVEFISTALKSKWDNTLIASEIGKTVFPKLIKNKLDKHILHLLEIILDFKKVKNEPIFGKGEIFEFKSIMEEYWLKESLDKYKQDIAKLCGVQAAKIAIQKIESILNDDKSQFNIIWIPTIEKSTQVNFPDRYEYQLVSFIRDMFELSNPNKIKEEIKTFLKSQHPIFTRIAFHIINFHYKELNKFFWDLKSNPINDSLNKHEIYQLIKNNSASFSKEQIRKIIKWIETANYYITENKKEQREKIFAYAKKEWLSALLDTNDPEVKSLYNKYNKINPTEPEHPGFDFWTESMIGTVSPLEKGEIFSKSNEEIAELLINFKEETGWKKPTVDGLSRTLQSSVNENPKKFTDNIKPFLKIPRIYQHALLSGFSDAWRGNKYIDWEIILDFICHIVEKDDFWSEEYEEGSYNYRNWIISTVTDLIKEGTQKDEHSFDPKFLPKAKKILLILLNNTKSDLSESIDLVTAVLNSTKGRIFSALINYSLRYARIYKKNEEKKWEKNIKEEFSKRLNRKLEPTFEFSVILGEYLPNLYYLDKDWVVKNINLIFPKNNEGQWEATFTGYLFYSSVVYKHLYVLLRSNNHYEKAIKTKFKDSNVSERLVQHICLGYLEGWEKLEDQQSLIVKLINTKNTNYFSYIVQFFWMSRKKLDDKIKSKIKPLWKALFEMLIQNESYHEYQKIFSQLSEWLILVDRIDAEIFKWLKISAKYVSLDFKTPFFVEYLLKHVKETPKEVGEIYLIMLNSNVYPDYKKENIQELIDILYNKNEKLLADKICNLYGSKGFDFLREIYIKYNKF